MRQTMRVAIIGAGLQARRRAPVVHNWPDAEIKIITAEHLEHAKELARELGCEAGVGWEGIVDRADVDAVLVLTPPNTHAEISNAAMKAGKHVLCEKPLSRTIKEAEELIVPVGVTVKDVGSTDRISGSEVSTNISALSEPIFDTIIVSL